MRTICINDQSPFGFHARNASEFVKLITSLGVKVYVKQGQEKDEVEVLFLMGLKARSYELVIESQDEDIFQVIKSFLEKENLL